MCLHKLSLVDDTIEAVGAPKKYQRLRKWISRIMIGWIVYIFYDCISEFINLRFYSKMHLDLDDYFLLFVTNYPEYVHILNALIWGTILGYISFRFHQVNDCLYILYFDLFENNADYRSRQYKSILVCKRITEAEDRKQYIWIIM
ncbi:hypothetical protein ALC60_07532 [Trachymyrmex zeteki]|uniref:Uncharacterized protein n=1 Tax=Mycetomoellerius zeteki TaxID=64791 RepID=A0A151WZL4_9HYME|nr:hypothetical protein ALC60_07532 [Trachymyrmex zeteki]